MDPADIAPLLADAAILDLEAKRAGTQQGVVVDAVSRRGRLLVTDATRDVSSVLSALTGLPGPATRSEPGWRAALQSAGLDEGARIDETVVNMMPGTLVANTVSSLMALTSALDAYDDGTWHHALNKAWDGVARDGGFDAAVGMLEARHTYACELGWALVTFESHKHVNLIWHQANKLERSFPDRTADDLLGWGWIGLRAALRHYDPDLGYTFSTYACTRIVGSMRDGVRAENPVPKRLNTFSRKAAAAEAALTQILGRTPTLEEVSQTIGVELSTLDVLHRTQPQASIDEIVSMLSERGTTPSWLVTRDDPAEAALGAMLADEIQAALGMLPPDEAAAVRLLVMDGMNPTEARAVTGATARQLRQRKERALAMLRNQLVDWDPGSTE